MEDGRNDTEGLFNMDEEEEEEEEDKGYIARYDNNTKSVPQIPNITESDKSCSLLESVLDQNYTGIMIITIEIILYYDKI